MISKTEVSASYEHISTKILEIFPEVLERVSFKLGQHKIQFRIFMQTPVDNPLMAIDSFNRQFQGGEKEWERGGAVGNAYTKAGQFERLSVEASYGLPSSPNIFLLSSPRIIT